MNMPEPQVTISPSTFEASADEKLKTLPKNESPGVPSKSEMHILPKSLRYFFYIVMGAQAIMILIGMIENFMN